jgi:hypothetical protein
MPLLRPQFKETLLNTLKKQSVNVHGQTRLLEDLTTGTRTGFYRVIGGYETLDGTI